LLNISVQQSLESKYIHAFVFNGHGIWWIVQNGANYADGSIAAFDGTWHPTGTASAQSASAVSHHKLAFVHIIACYSGRGPWNALVSPYGAAKLYWNKISGVPTPDTVQDNQPDPPTGQPPQPSSQAGDSCGTGTHCIAGQKP
jgi:hypothetical protein